jgi:hypothetical protein
VRRLNLLELIRLLLVAVLCALGAVVSRRNRELANSIVCAVGVFCLAIWCIVIVTGIWRSDPLTNLIHGKAAHGIVIAIWLGGFFAFGVGIQQSQARGIPFSLARVAILVFVLLVGIVGSFTGYMGPTRDPEQPIDSYHRFVVLHQFVLSTLLFILLSLWVRMFWPQSARGQEPVTSVSEGNATSLPQP